ncbi:hypothetical protein HU200_002756 [Digitaria exilis]|uniref:Metallo-beta-lactamase domain-containing protein n=1 Tax=Digitaria exilis TaxID=1010633 RepID=A0A835KUV6_9POAL|nr:hypothetical protein HU200_002756 [Digitaria exilis]
MALPGAATSFATLTAPPPPRRRRRAVTFRATASPKAQRRPQNVPGEFFVGEQSLSHVISSLSLSLSAPVVCADQRCIDCQTCRWMAPEVFRRVDGKAAVATQPGSQEERTKALQALLSCPTSSIHTNKPPKDILQVQHMFPLPLDEDLLPVRMPIPSIADIIAMPVCLFHPCLHSHHQTPFQGVYLCGYHSEHSFGATSYLVTHPQGNILIDSPRYTPKLADNIERLGGARYMFLTHIDDVADHRKWAERLKCGRIIHSGDVRITLLYPSLLTAKLPKELSIGRGGSSFTVEEGTADVEWKLHGNGPWNIGTDFELIHTPGHTPGSVCLHYKPLKVLFTGDHVAKSEESDGLNLFLIYSKQSVSLQVDSIRKLLDVNFEWLLPGHGYRIKYKDVQAKNAAMESLLANYTTS